MPRRRRRILSFVIPVLAAGAIALHAQQTPTFDAVSIKRHVGQVAQFRSVGGPPGQFRGESIPIALLISSGWPAPMGMKGAPTWVNNDMYDVSIVWPASTPRDQVPQMWRAMLAERFKLQAHYVEVDDPSYYLEVARPDGQVGKHMQRSSVDCDAVGAARRGGERIPDLPIGIGPCSIYVGNDTIIAGGITMGDLAPQLTGPSGRQVVNRTGLEGRWEFAVHYSKIDPNPNAPLGLYPSLFRALQDELGLKLVPFVDRNNQLVVDHIERPSEN